MSSTCYAMPTSVFQPAMRIVTAITNANPAQITTSFAHGYLSLLVVRLDIPVACGMQQINQMTGTITVTSTTTFTINIDSTNFTPFLVPVTTDMSINTCACVVPIGEDNSILYQAVQNVLPL